ncbi:MAG: hypothetical protein GX444_03850 [Myxococcales bacterium]|nr:hypothetical protein [Myxococcales bacterium]
MKKVSFLLILFFLLTISSLTNAVEKIPIFKYKDSIDDSQSLLLEDAGVFNLDYSEAEYDLRNGFMELNGPGYELRLNENSGHLFLLKQNIERREVEESDLSVNSNSLERETLYLLEKLGIKNTEIGDINTVRIVSQLEDKEGTLIGDEKIAGFIVSVKRRINGIPVFQGGAKFSYSIDGVLWRADIRWRPIEDTPFGFFTKVTDDEIQYTIDAILNEKMNGGKPFWQGGFFSYTEGSDHEKRSIMDYKYIFQYEAVDGSGIEMLEIDALKNKHE